MSIYEVCIKFKPFGDYVKDLFDKCNNDLYWLRTAYNTETYQPTLSLTTVYNQSSVYKNANRVTKLTMKGKLIQIPIKRPQRISVIVILGRFCLGHTGTMFVNIAIIRILKKRCSSSRSSMQATLLMSSAL